MELYSLFPRPRAEKGSVRVPFREGVIHIHSSHSNGAGSLEEIGSAAHELGLDFAIVTDHDTFRGRREEGEKTVGHTDVYVEAEMSTPAGHLLCFLPPAETNLPTDAQLKERCWKHYLGDSHVGMFTVTAHPNHPKSPWTRLEKFADGTEPLNLDVLWRSHLDESPLAFLLSAAIYPFQNYVGILRILNFPEKDRKAWDTMNTLSTGRFGLLGSDAHGVLPLGSRLKVKWPGYRESFMMGTNVVFGEVPSGDLVARKTSLYDGIRQGRGAMLLRPVGPFAGNDWRVECGAGKGRSGSRLTAPVVGGKCTSTVEIPSDFPFETVIRLYRNGELVSENSDAARPLVATLDRPGTYRVEVWARMGTRLGVFLRGVVPYVLYNPIYVL